MKLYDGGRAPNPQRVEFFIAEKGIEIERVPVSILKLEQKSAEFAKINPRQRLPVLELDDGTIITESVAICRYLEEIYPDPPLMGTNTLERATIEMWQRRIELELFLPVAFAFRHLHPAAKLLEETQVPDWGKLNQQRAGEMMKFLDDELSGHEFIAGDNFTIADITAITAMLFLKPARIKFPEDFIHLSRWYERIKSRPSISEK